MILLTEEDPGFSLDRGGVPTLYSDNLTWEKFIISEL